MPKATPSDAALHELREFGLRYPKAHTKSPWPGHLDLAVNDKTFAYLSIEGQPFKISCKLPRSHREALTLPFAKPTGYGLGRSGWVSAEFARDELPPVELFKRWIDESYRAQAPKSVVAKLTAASLPATATPKPSRDLKPPPAKGTAKAEAKVAPPRKAKTNPTVKATAKATRVRPVRSARRPARAKATPTRAARKTP